MNILCLLHAPFEEEGSIGEWAQRRGHTFTLVNSHAGQALPTEPDFDMLVVMGGPQSSLQYQKYPYLVREVELIKQAIEANKLVLGVCLGAQLIAIAADQLPERSPEREIGCFPITLTPQGQNHPLFKDLPQRFDVMHWHNDMPGLPENAVLIAQSEGCPRQIFAIGNNIVGLQCHFELTYDLTQNLIEHCPQDLEPGRFVQHHDAMLEADFHEMNQYLDTILDRMVELNAV